MRIVTTTVLGLTGIGVAVWLSTTLAARDQTAAPPTMSRMMPMAKSTMTSAQKIAMAMSAAPASLAAKATVLDWPAKEGAAPVVLRPGTNGWSCFPDMPDTKGNDPMCLDKPWMNWVDAYLAHTPPKATSVGIGYMTAPGGAWGSNTDPYAMAEAPGNQWGLHKPHLMILVPDLKSLEGISTDPGNGGPYVMYAGTPYAHIMAPVTGDASMAGRSG